MPKVEEAEGGRRGGRFILGRAEQHVGVVKQTAEKLVAKEAGATAGFDAETVAHLQQLAAGLVDDEVWSPTANTYNLCFNI